MTLLDDAIILQAVPEAWRMKQVFDKGKIKKNDFSEKFYFFRLQIMFSLTNAFCLNTTNYLLKLNQ